MKQIPGWVKLDEVDKVDKMDKVDKNIQKWENKLDDINVLVLDKK